MRVLVVDVGGTHVKLMHSDSPEARKFDSGDGFTPPQVVAGIKAHTADWHYDVITLGIPSPVLRGKVIEEPWNLGKGWVDFDWAAALGKPVKILNDAAMQALGSDEGGRMLFLGLGSGLGTALVDDGRIVALELAHLPFKDQTFEDLLGQRGLKALGEDRWRAVGARRRRTAARRGGRGIRGPGRRQRAPVRPAAAAFSARAQRQGVRGRLSRVGCGGAARGPLAKASTFAKARGTSRRRRSPLAPLASFAPRAHLRELFANDPQRAERFFLTVGKHLFVDYSKNLITQDSMTALCQLARKTGVEALRDRMFAGEPINNTEQRAVMHVALRNRSSRPMPVNGRDVMPDVGAALDHIRAFSEAVRGGQWLGYTGLRITDVVNIGIGGSDLGPAMATLALAPYTRWRSARALRVQRRRQSSLRHAAAAASRDDAVHGGVEDLHDAGNDGQRAIGARLVPARARPTKPPSPGTSWQSRPTNVK